MASPPNVSERLRTDAVQLANGSGQVITSSLATLDLGQNTIVNNGESPLVLNVYVLQARNLASKEAHIDIYLVATVGTTSKAIHRFDKELNPEWRASFDIPLVGDALFKCVCLQETSSENDDDVIGEFDLDVGDLFANGKVQQEMTWYKLKAKRGGGRRTQVFGEIQLQFSLFDSANLAASPEEIMKKFRLVIVKSNIKRLMDI